MAKVKCKITRQEQLQVIDSQSGKSEIVFAFMSFAPKGKEVEMDEKDHKYCQDAFKRFMNAQNRMKKYYES